MAKKVTGTLFRRNKTYWCRFRYQNRQYAFSLKTKRQSHAQHELERLMAPRVSAIFDGTFIEKFGKENEVASVVVETGKMLVADAWRHYVAATNRPDSGESTLGQYAYQFDTFCRWLAKHHPEINHLSDVDQPVAAEFAVHIRSRLAGGTYNKYVRLLTLVFDVLKKTAGISENPWQDMTRVKQKTNSRRDFTDEEVAAVLQKATGETLTLCLLGSHTALRLGDACTLLWREVNLVIRRITRKPNKTARTSGKVVIVPIHDELYRHLRSVQPATAAEYVCPEMAAKYQRDPTSVTDMLQKLFESCGLRLHREGTGKDTGRRAVVEVGFHSFRHTWVSRESERGTDSATIRAIVGWGSPAMEKVYTHVSPEHLERVINGRPSVMPIPEAPAQVPVQALTDEQLEQMEESIQAEIRRRGKAGSTKLGDAALQDNAVAAVA